MVVVGCPPGAVPSGADPAVYRPCSDGESVGPLVDESLFTFKPLRWCESLHRLEVTQGPETEGEREPEEVCRWLEDLRGIV